MGCLSDASTTVPSSSVYATASPKEPTASVVKERTAWRSSSTLDWLSCYGYTLPHSPHLAQRAGEDRLW